MSRIYETLKRMEKEQHQPGGPSSDPVRTVEILSSVLAVPAELDGAHSVNVVASPESRLVALTDPRGLGAEKFRALVTRLENVRVQKEFKSLQVTSSGISEGKTTVSANLAVTLAKRGHHKVLLIEGDLHRPGLASLLGLNGSRGLANWWASSDQEISTHLDRINGLPLWFLGAGGPFEHPSEILQSSRFAEEFAKIGSWFDWVVVDSTPMLPTADANLWSRLVDASLLVVREGVASIRALKKGLESLDKPKLVGIVLNEASEFDQAGYAERYYGLETSRKKSS
jgi:capsular exopolysaccharide synthesis family protein